MGNSTTSLMLQEEEITDIANETGCELTIQILSLKFFNRLVSRNQIVRLYSRFLSLDRQGENSYGIAG